MTDFSSASAVYAYVTERGFSEEIGDALLDLRSSLKRYRRYMDEMKSELTRMENQIDAGYAPMHNSSLSGDSVNIAIVAAEINFKADALARLGVPSADLAHLAKTAK